MVYELNEKDGRKTGNPNQQTDTGQRANNREGKGQTEYTGGGGNTGGGHPGAYKPSKDEGDPQPEQENMSGLDDQ